ncbi:hypothetical protein [Usitatibacter palustris]|uniref:Uncharacterized protein n=1 Tax=Usitatibacter palustris TaxID=2732487 RepID=A0A6M4HCZ9_9PROT|nr:hypothetical protein [Usitatibacter palustris]QJR16414.1 hypothetical protein DSM104440_03248 [Usitatibacter palustris]
MRIVAAVIVAMLGPVAAPPALAQGRMFQYEASQRQRMATETCLKKEETMHGAWCVKNCQPDFKLDLNVRPPMCIATKPDARYVPPQQWQPPEKPKGPPVKGA